MKKKNLLTLFVFGIFAFFAYNNLAFAAENCILGTETTKDVSGILKIFRIVAPLILLVFTILDAIKAVNSGGSFHFADGGDMSGQKVISRFVKRLIGVLLLFILPTLINIVFIWAGIWDENGGCDFDGNSRANATQPADPYGCYKYKICDAGCPYDYRWGKASDNKGWEKVDNSNCNRNKYGSEYACYVCNHDGSIKKWKANSDSDSECASGYHNTNAKQEECK